MKLKYILLALVLISIFGCNQDSINDSKKRNENWVWFIDKDSETGKWIPIDVGNPVQSGKYTKFFPNGTIYEKGTILDAEQIDTSFLFDINETLIKYKIMVNDTSYDYIVNDGYYQSFYQSTGKISETGTASNHTLGGNWTRYYESGKLEFRHIINGNSKWRISYYEPGQLKDSISYLNNKRNGLAKFWHDNGNLYEVSNWLNGKKNGLEIFHHKNGKIHQRSYWIDGLREGPDTLWFENGHLNQTTANHLGKSHGYTEIWYPNGNFKFKGYFTHGLFHDKCIAYHENGSIQTVGYMNNSEPYGSYKKYNNNGDLLQLSYFKNGKMDGEQKFYTNGVLNQIDIYKNGEFIKTKEITL